MNDEVNTQEAEAAEAAATPAARPGRASQFAGRRIYFDGDNKRREGSSRYNTIEVLRANPGATLEELTQLGAKREDILFEMKHNPTAVRLEQA